MVAHPVEGRGREDRVEAGVGDRQRRPEVGDDVRHPIAEPREPASRGLDHRRRAVERHDPARRQALGEPLGDAAGPAARVEHGLVARAAPAGRGRRCPTGSWGRRRGRRSSRPSRAAAAPAASSGIGRPGGLGARSSRPPPRRPPAPRRRPTPLVTAPPTQERAAHDDGEPERVHRRGLRRRRDPRPVRPPRAGSAAGPSGGGRDPRGRCPGPRPTSGGIERARDATKITADSRGWPTRLMALLIAEPDAGVLDRGSTS